MVPPDEWIECAKIPAIISGEQFELVQGKPANNRSLARRNNKAHQYLLRALVSCGVGQLSCLALMLSSQLCGADRVSHFFVSIFTPQRPHNFSLLPRYKLRRNSISEGSCRQCLVCFGSSASSHLANAFAFISRSISA